MTAQSEFVPLNLCVLTVSDTRTPDDDSSGDYLALSLGQAGHRLCEKRIVQDNRYAIRAIVAQWIADEDVHGVLVSGGTGFTGRDSTPEAIAPLLDKQMPGFGEMFRMLSYDEIGTSTMQSRATAGVANATYIFALPGSTGACRDGWDDILRHQLDIRFRPCNFAELMPRLNEGKMPRSG